MYIALIQHSLTVTAVMAVCSVTTVYLEIHMKNRTWYAKVHQVLVQKYADII